MITALVDGELSLEDVEQVQAHLDMCDDCQARQRMESRLKAFLKERLSQVSTPERLRGKIEDALAGLDGKGGPSPAEEDDPPERGARAGGPPARSARWLPLVVILAVLVSMSFTIAIMKGGRVEEGRGASPFMIELISIHRAATGAGVFQIRSHDRRELSAWLGEQAGPFAAVPDLEAFGLTAAGGRTLELFRNAAAMILYRDYGEGAPDVVVVAGPLALPEQFGDGVAHRVGGRDVYLDRYQGVAAAFLSTEAARWVLLSERDDEALLPLAGAMIEQLDGGADTGGDRPPS